MSERARGDAPGGHPPHSGIFHDNPISAEREPTTYRGPRGNTLASHALRRVDCASVDDKLHTPGDGDGAAPAPQASPAAPTPAASSLAAHPNLRNGTRKGERRGLYGNLDADSFESMCLLASRGMPAAEIAGVLLRSERKIEQLLKRPSTKARIAYLRGQQALRELEHEHELRELLPKARLAVAKAMAEGSIPQSQRSAHWLHEQLIPKPAQRVEKHVTLDGRVQHDLAPVFGQIKDLLASVREANQGDGWRKRVKSGGEAIARPALTSGE